MKIIDFDFLDQQRSRKVPVRIYIPEKIDHSVSAIIFNPGYQNQKDLINPDVKLANQNYTYLAEYFTKKGFAFISIQHEISGDKDGLEIIDPSIPQNEAREHLYKRGVRNILFVLDKIKEQNLPIQLEKFIISGHSNGGDISKYFANLYPDLVTHIIVLDGRRCRFNPKKFIKLLMFEADDTYTDLKVLPEPNRDNNTRSYIDWTIIKPSGSFHSSYKDQNITKNLKNRVIRAIDWFLKN